MFATRLQLRSRGVLPCAARTFATRPALSGGSAMPAASVRAFHASRIARVNPSDPLNDNPEIAHHGINVDKPVRMDTAPQPELGEDFPIIMVGAGNIMFGSQAGPWNHSFRLEHKLGPRLKVQAVIDPDTERAKAVLANKCASFVTSAYEDAQVFKTIEDCAAAFKAQNMPEPRAIIIGTPPMYRGGISKGRHLELDLIKAFPNVGYFVEKPVSTAPIEEVKEVEAKLVENKNIVSVGYMLRYLRCVQKMKQIIHENNLTVMATNARYSAAYESIDKIAWWDKSRDMGPVIEQGTHFCDLSRYLGGDVDISSVVARSVEWYEKPGELSRVPINEASIPEEERIPRITGALWKYESGGVGSFMHTVALQGTAYDCELEVWADGYHMRLIDPYGAPMLLVRRPGDDHVERHQFTDDDPFFSEMSEFVDAVEGEPNAHILSSYEDATKTYELTWAIRLASEKSAAKAKSLAK